jgi:DNA-binding beta-propeller fold protein YncE
MRPRYWLPLSVVTLLAFGAILGCNGRKDLPVAPSRVVSLNVSVPQTQELQASLLGSTSNILLYSATSADRAVTGSYGPFSEESGAGNLNVSVGLPGNGTWLLALELVGASDQKPLAVGAAQFNITDLSGSLTIQMGSVSRNCYQTDTWMDPGGSYFSFQNDTLMSGYFTAADINVTKTGSAYYILTSGSGLVQYMGNGPLVNFAAAPVTESFVSSATSKLAVGAPVSTLQAGDVYCFQLSGGGHAWLQVNNPGSPTVGPSFRFRVNTTQLYYAYERTAADIAGTCLPGSTLTIGPSSTYTLTNTLTPTLTLTPPPTMTFTTMATWSNTPTASWTTTLTETNTPSPTATPTPTGTSSFTATPTSTPTNSSTLTRTFTASSTSTKTSTNTRTITNTPTITATPTWTGTSTYTFTNTPTTTVTVVTMINSPSKSFGVAVDYQGYVFIADSLLDVIQVLNPASGANGPVTTFAGTGAQGSGIGPNLSASFNYPKGIAVEPYTDNVYVADTNNDLIRYISAGNVSTVAGQAVSAGYADGAGVSAVFNLPTGVAVDTMGDIYVADSGNNMIRYITSAWQVSTLAGQLTPGFNNNYGTSAQFNVPTGVALYGSNLYITDSGNNMIRTLSLSTGYVSTLAGQLTPGAVDAIGTAASFNEPMGLTVDGNGYLYVTDSGNSKIREINIATQQVTTLAGSGYPGKSDGNGYTATFEAPYGITVNSAGTTLYVADTYYDLIRQVQF